jgi:hypothetical protein
MTLSMRNIIFVMVLVLVVPIFAIESENFQADIYIASGGLTESSNFEVFVSMGDALAGKTESDNFEMGAGSVDAIETEWQSRVVLVNLGHNPILPDSGEEVSMYARWKAQAGLDRVIVSIDEGDGWYEETVDLEGTEEVARYTWAKELPDETVVKWKMKCYDVLGSIEETNEMKFVIGSKKLDTEAPELITTQYPIDPAVGEEIWIEFKTKDDYGLDKAVLEINGQVVGVYELGGATDVTPVFTYDTSQKKVNDKLEWNLRVSDGAGHESVESGILTLTDSAPDVRECVGAQPSSTDWSNCFNNLEERTIYNCNYELGAWVNTTKEVRSCDRDDYTMLIVLVLLIPVMIFVYINRKNMFKF